MDAKSIEAMKNKVKQFEKFIEECNDPKQLLLLNEAKDMFSQTLKEWEERSGSGFVTICKKCGSTSVTSYHNSDEYESETYMKCDDCGNDDTIYS